MYEMYSANFAFIDGLKYCKRVYNASANRRYFEIRIFNRDYIRDLRKLLGWSQDTMAVAFGVNTHSLSQFECNPDSNIKSIPFNPLLMNEYMGKAIEYMRNPSEFCKKYNCSPTKARKFCNIGYVHESDKGQLIVDSGVEYATINSKLPFKLTDVYSISEGKVKVAYCPVDLLGITNNYLEKTWDWSKDAGFSMKLYKAEKVSNKDACKKYNGVQNLIKNESDKDSIQDINKVLDNILDEVKNINKALDKTNSLITEFSRIINHKYYS